ncbi:hypothetical protein ROA7023_02704 [Roseisalinus antarcticus]|uniref:Endonuclease/exonuclease/phosphatase domain-containing protein n=2 Tax=Roseisalinus antarcticus TaxID=254357 RepID=A0A1Y5TA11_9RHOB|nr:hypothetical protein ROA7023_02704 [Roseisalinus antarcticus]
MAAAAIVAEVSPDILVLTDFDYDAGLATLRTFAAAAGGFPHAFALRPNAGLPSGLDLDGDGYDDNARDAQGYGRFSGDGGLAILSRWPVQVEAVQDFSGLLWRDLPGAILPVIDGAPFPSAEAQAVQRLSSTGHWVVPITAPGGTVTLLVSSATPPVFDGPEDRNGLRNRDELHLWEVFLDGKLGTRPDAGFVLLANTNLDPQDGDGLREAMATFLARPDIQDPRPESRGGAEAPGGDAFDTADWAEDWAGNLRVSYVLPSVDWTVSGAGVFWPAPGEPGAALLGDDGLLAGPHRLVWADLVR